MAGLRVAICATRRGSNGRCWKRQSREISSPTFRSVTNRSTVLTRGTTCKMRKILFEGIARGSLTERPPVPDEAALAELAKSVNKESQIRLGRSLSIRQVDAGSCNGCELEIHALNNAFYDLERFGLRFVASPRHADVLMVTGPVTKNMREALERTYNATPGPKWVVAVGSCAADGGIFAESYAVEGGVKDVIPVDLHIRGCPPSPVDLLKGLLALLRHVER
jgi:Ni,Fe-hydrogenase III small subunit